jgi:hypothetical protein
MTAGSPTMPVHSGRAATAPHRGTITSGRGSAGRSTERLRARPSHLQLTPYFAQRLPGARLADARRTRGFFARLFLARHTKSRMTRIPAWYFRRYLMDRGEQAWSGRHACGGADPRHGEPEAWGAEAWGARGMGKTSRRTPAQNAGHCGPIASQGPWYSNGVKSPAPGFSTRQPRARAP